MRPIQFRILCLLAALTALAAAPAVRLKNGIFSGPGDLHGGAVKRKTIGRSHVLVAFSAAPGGDILAGWKRRGIRVAGVIPPAAFILSIPDNVDPRFAGSLWAGRMGAPDKLSRALDVSGGSAPGGYVVEFYPDVDMALARDLVAEEGMQVQDHPDLLPDQLVVLGSADQVASLAAWDEVAYVFPASQDLLDGAHVLACAGPMTEQGLVGQYVTASTGWSAAADGNVYLSYVFAGLTTKLPASTVQSDIFDAFAQWAKYAPIVLSAGNNAADSRTVAILFASGSHGDGYPFDGPGGILAHTFYPNPPNPEPIAGDMHFDADEAWDNPQKIDLYSVALHEAGHALGLGHSDQPGAVMYPYYHLGAQLTDDDIKGIRAIYAASNMPPAPPPLSLAVTSPSAPAVSIATSTIAMSGTVSGGAGNAHVTWTSNQGFSGSAIISSASWTIAVVPLNVGLNIVTVTAIDGAGTVASKVTSVTRTSSASNPVPPVTPSPTPAPPPTPTPTPTPNPTAPPSLAITSPAFTIVSTSADTIALTGTASADATSVTWSNSTGTAGTASGISLWSAIVPLITGNNSITVKAINGAGSSWRSLTVIRR